MAHELVPGFFLRQATQDDHKALLKICLQTGNSGADATGMDADEDLVGLFYAVPYQVLEPDHCFVITQEGEACGYVMGALDTPGFMARFEQEWLPSLQKRASPPPDNEERWKGFDWLRHRIHEQQRPFYGALRPYPAQGHIDLLPQARGKGVGAAALQHLTRQFATAGAKGIHLEVSPHNKGAQAFYDKLGFTILNDDGLPDHTVYMVKSLA